MVIDFPQSESGKLRTTAHHLDTVRENIATLTKSIVQVEADIALEKEMDRLYKELGYSDEDVEKIKRHAFKSKDLILGSLLREQK